MPTSPFPILLLLLTIASTSSAQDAPSRILGPQPSQVRGVVLRGPLEQPSSWIQWSAKSAPPIWKEGALVGGIVSGLGLALLIDGLCSSDSGGNCGSAVAGGLLGGGVLGGLVGALIGGQFPKAQER
jgi:hypothetical protein